MENQDIKNISNSQEIKKDTETPFAAIFYMDSKAGIETMSFPGLVYVGQNDTQYQAVASDGQYVLLEKANIVGLHILDIETYQNAYDGN